MFSVTGSPDDKDVRHGLKSRIFTIIDFPSLLYVYEAPYCRDLRWEAVGVSVLRVGERVKSLSAAMCSAGLSGYVLPGQSSTLGCVNSGAGTFSCQAPLPVDQRTWPSVTVSLSGAKCSRCSANRL